MLARSTACRHGLGRACTKATSISRRRLVADQQVGRLDVAASLVPQLADDPQAVVDHLGVDLGLAELGGAGEELGDQQVLPLGSELDEPEGRRVGLRPDPSATARSPPADEAADGVEWLLVLQAAVQRSRPSLYQRSERR